MKLFFTIYILLSAISISSVSYACPDNHTCSHAKAMWGQPKYDKDFTHFDYTNPNAPKGGILRRAAIGSFDSFNSNILKGIPARGSGVGMIYDTLLTDSGDESFTKYGLLAKEIQIANDGGSVSFVLRDEAKWHDGTRITPEDVIFSFNILVDKGLPYYRSYYREVEKVEKTGKNRVTFTFTTTTNRELPLILGQIPILSKAYYDKHDFTKTSLDIPLGSGPYKIDSFDAGKWIKYKRVKNYWGKDLPVNKGRNNFDELIFEYYKDSTVAIEAFKAGEYDLRQENISKVWATSYNIDKVKNGKILKEEIAHERPTGMQAFAYNIRLPKFSDKRVREALSYTFDFEWTNKNIFYGAYTRTNSFFSNSEFASRGLPKGLELKILKEVASKGGKEFLPQSVFEKEFKVPTTNGSGNIRSSLRKAKKLLKEAGLTVDKGILKLPDGKPFELEFLLSSPSFERLVSPMTENLKKLGIKATIRTVDSSQYIKRVESFDFDIIVQSFGQSLSPGNEQEDYWGSSREGVKGSRNVIGIKNPVIDALVEKIIKAQNKETLVAATKALDRVLLNNHYVIPQYHIRNHRVIYWNKFSRPKTNEKFLLGIKNWWFDKEKAIKISKK